MALFVLQFVTMFAPLVVLPYLSRVLGLSGFGIVILSLSACSIGVIVTDFGFNLSGTYKISKKRDDVNYVSELIGAIFYIKLLLVVFCLCVFLLYSYFLGFSVGSYMLSIYIGFNVLVQAFLPTWFFQGIEKMKNITIYMVISKVFYVFLVFVFIKGKEDFETVVLIYALSNFVALLIAVICVYRSGYYIRRPVNINVAEVFKDSFQFFLSRAAVSIYTSISAFLVGSFAGAQQVAMYGASEKLYQASQTITSSIAQALFPYMANNKGSKLFIKILTIVGFPLAISCAVFGFWADDIMSLIFGDEFRQSGEVFRLFLVITVVNFLSVNFGYPAFAGIGRIYIANYTVMLGALVQSICLLILYMTNSFSGLNVVSSILITEVFVMVSRVFCYFFFK